MKDETDARAGAGIGGDRAARLERQLAEAQRITHTGSWEWDCRTNAITWSDELYRIYGLAPQSREITLERFAGFLHPDDRERVMGEVRRALERGEPFAHTERIERADGAIRVLETLGDVARDPAGNIIGLVGTCRDVTDERRRDETARLYAMIVEHVQIGLMVWHVDDADRAEQARLLAFNPAGENVGGVSLIGRIGERLCDLFPNAGDSELVAALARVARGGGAEELAECRFRNSPNRLFRVKLFPLPMRAVGIAAEDITAEIRAQRLRAAGQRVLELIATGEPLEAVLTELVLTIEKQAPDTLASVLLVDDEGRVRHGAAPSLPRGYVRAVDGAPIGPQAGSCGTAAHRREPVIVVDIENDPLWASYRNLAVQHGLRACWSAPIFALGGRVAGTFALYYREPRGPMPDDWALIEGAAHVAGIAIQRADLIDRLRALSAHVESVREDERTVVAREIHDELGQMLTALKIDLDWIARRARGASVDGDAIGQRVEAMAQMTDELIDRVRRISAELRPGVLDDLGIVAAIEWQAQELEHRSELRFFIHAPDDLIPLDRKICTGLFRIFQEAITNVVRHAEASRVDVDLEPADGMLTLRVKDDGKGIDADAIARPTSFGLLGMRERALALGGSANFARRPEGGTEVSVRVPLGNREVSGAR